MVGITMKLPKITISQKPTYIKCAQDIDVLDLFERIEERCDSCFILESLGEAGHTSRYSVIGFDPAHIICAKGSVLSVDKRSYRVDNPYYALREIVPQDAIARNFAGGLVGFLSYDCMNYFEPAVSITPHDRFEQFVFGVYTDGLILDKTTNELVYFFYNDNRIKQVHKFLRAAKNRKPLEIRFLGDTAKPYEHYAHVEYVKEQIRIGNTFQCEVGFKTEYNISGDVRPIYRRLREVNPSPFMYFVKFGKEKIIGASPELLFSLRDGEMETFPLAGTIGRGKTKLEDRALARKLLQDPKEIAEHAMLVDLHRNDLGRVARFGTVKVRSFMDIKRFSHVQHISSEIAGIIRTKDDMFSALASNFPAGTLTGTPKIESMKIINLLEQRGRGPYGGALGHFGFNGDCIFAIPIRTLFIHGDYAYTQTCGGIVADSDPKKEYEEIQNKMAAMHSVLKSFES